MLDRNFLETSFHLNVAAGLACLIILRLSFVKARQTFYRCTICSVIGFFRYSAFRTKDSIIYAEQERSCQGIVAIVDAEYRSRDSSLIIESSICICGHIFIVNRLIKANQILVILTSYISHQQSALSRTNGQITLSVKIIAHIPCRRYDSLPTFSVLFILEARDKSLFQISSNSGGSRSVRRTL